ncbi:hypothetical protein [Marinimicrococcus flavescens]|uniref:Uncharacterized protein n=1 Tax=Marinimicrococcus flavescens TaxID=3031815 RepID=A0AAP3XRT7_9PROT|nr:hypothetical protein [Marinimicrococcus flavescens]
MTFWLVTATPHPELLGELEQALRERRFEPLQPFGRALSAGLVNARRKGGQACWEEEDYCDPPLAEERAAVLDRYFTSIEVEAVEEGQGWRQLTALPRLFSGLSR